MRQNDTSSCQLSILVHIARKFSREKFKHEYTSIIYCDKKSKRTLSEWQRNSSRFGRIDFWLRHWSNERVDLKNEITVSPSDNCRCRWINYILLSTAQPSHIMKIVGENLTQARLSELIELALSDKVSFKAIREEFGLREIEVKNLMRYNLRQASYTAWRKRIFRKSR